MYYPFAYLLFFIAFVSNLNCIQAQVPYYWSLNEDDGLPSADIYGIYQAADGHVWIGTDGGMCRYNGDKLHQIIPESSTGTAMANIKQGQTDDVWFSNFNKQLFYSDGHRTEEFELPLQLKEDFDYYLQDSFVYIYADTLLVYNLYTKQWKGQPTPFRNKGFSFNEDSPGQKILVELNTTAWTINGASISKFGVFDKKLFNGRAVNFFVECLHVDSNRYFLRLGNKIYVGDKNSILSKENNFFAVLNAKVYKLEIDRVGNVWATTSKGAYLFEKIKNGYAAPKVFFEKYQISAFCHDREGNYWFGTLHQGLFVVPNLDILLYDKAHSNLSSEQANVFETAHDQFLLIGHNNGTISKLDTRLGRVVDVYDTKQNENVVALDYNEAEKLLWVGLPCIYQFNWDNTDLQYCSNLCFHTILRYNENYLFTGLRDRLLLSEVPFLNNEDLADNFLNKFDAIESFDLDCKGKFRRNLLNRKRTYDIAFDPQNPKKVWVAHADKLCIYHETGRIEEIKDKEGFSISAKSLLVEGQYMWVGTIHHGLYQFDQGKEIYSIDKKSGLASNYCNAICQQDSFLWIASFDGLSRLNTNTKEVSVLDKLDGLVSNKIRDVVYLNNKIWVATSKGVVSINPSTKLVNQTAPLIALNVPIVNNQQIEAGHSIFNYRQNDFYFSFEGSALRSRGNFNYEYRLTGLDSSWSVLPSSTNFVRFQGLSYGNYNFEVRAVNEDKVRSAKTAYYKFTIQPAFWQTWWFSFLIVLGIVAVVSGIIVLRYQNLQSKQALKNSVQKLKMRALQAQMNPHFVFNSMTAIQGYWMAKERKKALIYHAQFAKLMRLIFEYSQETTIDISKEIDFLKIYLSLEEIRFENQVETAFIIDPNVEQSGITVPPLLIQPIVENAFKHGFLHKKEKGNLTIELKLVDQFLYCCVEDNGVGLQQKQQHDWGNQRQDRKSSQEVTIERLNMLKSLYQIKTNKPLFNMINLADLEQQQKGVRIEIYIPYL